MLWILASVAFALLCYEIPTLVTAVLLAALEQSATPCRPTSTTTTRRRSGFPRDSTRLYLPTDDVIAGFAYPPPAILPFLRLSQLPLGAALLLFTLASYARAPGRHSAVVLAILRRQGIGRSPVDRDRGRRMIAIALGPTYMNAIFGQVNAFVLASAVAFVSFAPLLPPIAALLLAAGIWLKMYPIVMLAAIGVVGPPDLARAGVDESSGRDR